MEKDQIIKSLADVFNEVFADHNVTLSEGTSARDIAEWDSLTNIELMVAVEQKFGVNFRSADIQNLQNVGDLVDLVYRKTSA